MMMFNRFQDHLLCCLTLHNADGFSLLALGQVFNKACPSPRGYHPHFVSRADMLYWLFSWIWPGSYETS